MARNLKQNGRFSRALAAPWLQPGFSPVDSVASDPNRLNGLEYSRTHYTGLKPRC